MNTPTPPTHTPESKLSGHFRGGRILDFSRPDSVGGVDVSAAERATESFARTWLSAVDTVNPIDPRATTYDEGRVGAYLNDPVVRRLAERELSDARATGAFLDTDGSAYDILVRLDRERQRPVAIQRALLAAKHGNTGEATELIQGLQTFGSPTDVESQKLRASASAGAHGALKAGDPGKLYAYSKALGYCGEEPDPQKEVERQLIVAVAEIAAAPPDSPVDTSFAVAKLQIATEAARSKNPGSNGTEVLDIARHTLENLCTRKSSPANSSLVTVIEAAGVTITAAPTPAESPGSKDTHKPAINPDPEPTEQFVHDAVTTDRVHPVGSPVCIALAPVTPDDKKGHRVATTAAGVAVTLALTLSGVGAAAAESSDGRDGERGTPATDTMPGNRGRDSRSGVVPGVPDVSTDSERHSGETPETGAVQVANTPENEDTPPGTSEQQTDETRGAQASGGAPQEEAPSTESPEMSQRSPEAVEARTTEDPAVDSSGEVIDEDSERQEQEPTEDTSQGTEDDETNPGQGQQHGEDDPESANRRGVIPGLSVVLVASDSESESIDGENGDGTQEGDGGNHSDRSDHEHRQGDGEETSDGNGQGHGIRELTREERVRFVEGRVDDALRRAPGSDMGPAQVADVIEEAERAARNGEGSPHRTVTGTRTTILETAVNATLRHYTGPEHAEVRKLGGEIVDAIERPTKLDDPEVFAGILDLGEMDEPTRRAYETFRGASTEKFSVMFTVAVPEGEENVYDATRQGRVLDAIAAVEWRTVSEERRAEYVEAARGMIEAERVAAEREATSEIDMNTNVYVLAAQNLSRLAEAETDERIANRYRNCGRAMELMFMNNSDMLEPFMIAAIAANGDIEGVGCQPGIEQYQGGPGRGGWQWGSWNKEYDRFGHYPDPPENTLVGWSNRRGLDWRTMEANIGFLIWELQNTERNAYNALMGTSNVREATATFMRKFERPLVQTDAAAKVRQDVGTLLYNLLMKEVKAIEEQRRADATSRSAERSEVQSDAVERVGISLEQLTPYYQFDGRWADTIYSTAGFRDRGNEGAIRGCGCAPTTFAGIISTITPTGKTPIDIATEFLERGANTDIDCSTEWRIWEDPAERELMEQKFGIVVERVSLEGTLQERTDRFRELLSTENSMILVSMGEGRFAKKGHIMAARAVNNNLNDNGFYGRIEVLDPNNREHTENTEGYSPSEFFEGYKRSENGGQQGLRAAWIIRPANP